MESKLGLDDCSGLLTGEAAEKLALPFAKPPISTLPMIGSESLKWEDFERLCCRLVAKKYQLAGCRRYGRGGPKSQHGIDIYGFKRLGLQEQLVAFQCKKVNDLTISKLRKAVNDFQNGDLSGKVSEFTIVFSCQFTSSEMHDELMKLRQVLFQSHIMFDLWDWGCIAKELKPYPEIVEAFFRQDVVDALCQPVVLGQHR